MEVEILWDDVLRLTSGMDIPPHRLKNRDINWLLRNLHFRNGEHPNYDKVLDLLKDINKHLNRFN